MVQGGNLAVTACSIEAIPSEEQATASLHSERALSILGGHVELLQIALHGHLAGAISIEAATLILIECTICNSRAQSGGAMLIEEGAEVDVALSLFEGNSALSSGGALQVRK